MKKINLKSIVQANKELTEITLKKYFNFFGINPKPIELNSLKGLVDNISTVTYDMSTFNHFYFGYTIPQISREFDLLRFGKESVLNIELKSESDSKTVEFQLQRNRYYLSFLNVPIYSYTYVSSINTLYTLNENNDLIEGEFTDLIKVINTQELKLIKDVNDLFNPSNYLVSPFNSTEKFIEGKYFLTGHQELIKKEAMLLIGNKDVSTFISIMGYAGTGKTLLTYDLVKEYISNKKEVLVVQSGMLNDGHDKLKSEYGWDIISAKSIYSLYSAGSLLKYHLIVVDETQRIYPNQLDYIIDFVNKNNGNCVFSYDGNQCLQTKEINNNIEEHILNTTSPKVFNLTTKIRTNKEIATFILSLFDKKKNFEKIERTNVLLEYFDNNEDAKSSLEKLKEQDWKIINFTPSRKDTYPYDSYKIQGEVSTHGVIGQEFDNVVAVIDSHFHYNEKSRLSTKDFSSRPYYHPTRMLFQIMTRTRKKLYVIVVNNNEIMERCMKILE